MIFCLRVGLGPPATSVTVALENRWLRRRFAPKTMLVASCTVHARRSRLLSLISTPSTPIARCLWAPQKMSCRDAGPHMYYTFIRCNIQPLYHQACKERYFFSGDATITACIKSRWVLESVNSSTCLIFRLPSSSVTMWSMKIDSRVASTPIAVFTLVVSWVPR